MSFVSEAGYQGSPARSCEMTSPVWASKTKLGPAATGGAMRISEREMAMAFSRKLAKGSILILAFPPSAGVDQLAAEINRQAPKQGPASQIRPLRGVR